MAALDRQGIPAPLLQREDERKTSFITAIGTLQAFSLISTEKVTVPLNHRIYYNLHLILITL
jgi:hypothetical protein